MIKESLSYETQDEMFQGLHILNKVVLGEALYLSFIKKSRYFIGKYKHHYRSICEKRENTHMCQHLYLL